MRFKFPLLCFCLVMAETFCWDGYAKPQDLESSTVPINTPITDTKTPTSGTTMETVGPPDLHDKAVDQPNVVGAQLLRNLLSDQKEIWSSPGNLRSADASWLFPLSAVTGGLLATDRSAAKWLFNNPNRQERYRTLSNYGVASLVGAGGGLYLWGKISRDDHRTETGILAGEAAIDALGMNTVLKYSFGRERPYQDRGRGAFFLGGTSFPSDHAAAAWSIASVITHEYPGFLTKLLAYGVATGVSVSRVEAREHFPSDVLVGSALGWLVGRYVYGAHHDPELGGAAVGSLTDQESQRDHQHMGSPFVPLDSWVYAAFERLAGLGYFNTAIMGLKPWTRIECARLTEEAEETAQQRDTSNQAAAELLTRLEQEFAYERDLLDGGRNRTANIESVYARGVSISGPALTDSFHFGQTIFYDFGRPFERGTNAQAGGSFYAAAGAIVLYVRAEYQHAPSAPVLSTPVRDFIAQADLVPLSEVRSSPLAGINRPELLDAYAGVNLGNWQLSFGRQSLSWTTGPGGSMLLSDNIAPIDMVRLTNPEPFQLPGFLRRVGPVRTDSFFGELRGRPYVPHPFLYGQMINIRLFSFLEVGWGRTTTIGTGGTSGDALTTMSFLRSVGGVWDPRTHSSPGDTNTNLTWALYLPKVRNYVVLYGNGYADDDVITLEEPARNPWYPGIYITRIPGIPKLDLHVEGVSTEQSGTSSPAIAGLFNYFNYSYHDGYTNNGFLIGNSVGRAGRAIQSWLTYWISPRNTLQFFYKHNSVNPDFVRGGASWQDYGLKNELYLRSGFYMKADVQYEHVSRYPLLFNGPQRNVTAILEMGFYPEKKMRAQRNDP